MRKEIERSDIKAVEFPLKTKFIIIKTETDMQTPKLFLLLERFLFVFAKIFLSKIPERNRTMRCQVSLWLATWALKAPGHQQAESGTNQ